MSCWRTAPFLMTALGIVLLTLVFLQRQIGREREIAFRDAALAAEGNRIKTTFLANVSHELRTPLQSILGYSELLSDGLADPKSRAQLDALRQQGEMMTRLINDLIDLSAVESGSFQLSLCPAAPGEIVRQTVESLRPRAAAKGLALEAEIDGGVPAWVNADGGRWRQVIVNLVGNAIKFTDRGGIVAIDAAREGRDLLLTVSDTGIGIPADKLALIGQPFMQVQNEYTRKYEGTGLGLSLVKGLVALHGGSFVVESRPGEGTVITIRIPADGAGVAREGDPRPATASTVDFPPRLAAGAETVYQPSDDGKDTQDERARQKTA